MARQLPYDQALQFITTHERFLLVSHISPDGDTLGSALALRQALLQLGKNVVNTCIDTPQDQYNFLPGIEIFTQTFQPGQFDAIIAIDCADLRKMTGFYARNQNFFETTPLLNIDHHPTNDHYGSVALVDDQVATAGQIVFELIEKLNTVWTPDMCTNILTSLYFDTGSFQHGNTTSEVLQLAGQLKSRGADHHDIAYFLFRMKSYPTLKLWGRALSKFKVDQDRGIAWVFLSVEDFAETETTVKDLDGLVILLHGIPGIKLTVLLSERENGVVKGSIRTIDGVDASYYAGAFGGGGHHKAAGFSARLLLDQAEQQARTIGIQAA